MTIGLPVYSVDQVRDAESQQFAITAPGELMQRASFALAVGCCDVLLETYGIIYGTTAVIVAGPGNNGGDALFAGAYLARRGVKVSAHVVVPGTFHAQAMSALLAAGGVAGDFCGQDFDLAIDGIAGLGSSRPVDGELAPWINTQPVVISVDIPSGVNAESGACDANACVHADVTYTFGAIKPGLVLGPGAEFAGDVELVDIGLDALDEVEPLARIFTQDSFEALMPEPAFSDYKYSRGVVALAAGSESYPGAAQLTTLGALHSGVGMVMFREPGTADMGITQEFPSVVLTDGNSGRIKAWGVGPGFEGSDSEEQFLTEILSGELPVVLDAGALRLVSTQDSLRTLVATRSAITVLTPHVGEFLALFPGLTHMGVADVMRGAHELGCVVVGKGPRTVIASPTGQVFIDIEGTPALATAGSGDVLTGIIAGLLAARPDADPVEVVAAGVWMHGRAGRIAELDAMNPTAVDIGFACAEVRNP